MSEWKTVPLGTLAYGIRGVSYKPHHLRNLKDESDVILLRSNNIQSDGINFDDIQIIPDTIVKNEQIAKDGDILVCMSNGSKLLVGKNVRYRAIDERHTVGSFCSLFRVFSTYDKTFVYYIFQSNTYKKAIDKILSGSAINNLHNSTIENININIPTSLDEQRRIANILTSADKAIAASRAIVEKYTAIKQGLMTDLLDNGAYVKISSFATVVGGSTPNTNDSQYWDGSNVWITPTDLSVLDLTFIGTSQRRVTDAGVKKATGTLIPKNTVIISCRAPVGYCAVVTTPFTFNQGCKAIIGKGFNSLYLYYQLSRAKDALERVSSGTTFLELPKKELERFEVTLPTLEEQCRIANILTAADTKLTSEREHLKKLENIKRGLMNDLLTNKVSTNSILHKHKGR